jgi:hypothetical protein
MKDMLFVACLALLAFGTANLIFSAAVLVGMRTLRFDCRPRALARRYLLVRAFPGTVSLLFVVTLFLPILCRHEPGGENEQLGVAMAVHASAAVLIIVAAAVRGLHGIWVTRRLSKSWGLSARALDILRHRSSFSGRCHRRDSSPAAVCCTTGSGTVFRG